MTLPIDTLIERSRAKRLKIAVVGDTMTDVYVHGQLGECQEDCYKFVEESRMSVPGGAANAVQSLLHWNVLLAELVQRGTLPVKTRYVVNGKFMWRHDLEQNDACFEADREAAMFYLRESPVDAILISDYDKGFLTPDFIQEIIKLANDRGVPVVADAKRPPETYAGALLKVNKDYCSRLITGTYVKRMIVTRGAESPIMFGDRKEGLYVRLKEKNPVPCVNHVGAGDCFAAHLTLALAHGLSLEDAAAIAHSAGRCYVQHPHNRPPTIEEIRADMIGS